MLFVFIDAVLSLSQDCPFYIIYFRVCINILQRSTISNMSFETTSNLRSCVIAQYEGYSESKQEEVDIAL